MAVTNYIAEDGLLVGELTGGIMRNYQSDALGSVVATVLNGVAENSYRYKPYGGLLAKSGTAPDPSFLWNGGSGYRATTLTNASHYVRRRHFSNLTGQWTSADPLWPIQPPYASVVPVAVADFSGMGQPVGTGIGTTAPAIPATDHRFIRTSATYYGIQGTVILPSCCEVPNSAYIDFYLSFMAPDLSGTLVDCGVSFACRDAEGIPGTYGYQPLQYGWHVAWKVTYPTNPALKFNSVSCPGCVPNTPVTVTLQVTQTGYECRVSTPAGLQYDSQNLISVKHYAGSPQKAKYGMGAEYYTVTPAKHSIVTYTTAYLQSAAGGAYANAEPNAGGTLDDTANYLEHGTRNTPFIGTLRGSSNPCQCGSGGNKAPPITKTGAGS